VKDSFTIVGLGEILWDMFPDGARFGGAPANFACSAAGLSQGHHTVCIASCVGDDDLGQQALAALHEHQVNTACVATSDKPTGQVLVTVDDQGKASYEFAADAAWDNFEWSVDLQRVANGADVVCFGSLGQRSEISRNTIQHFLTETNLEKNSDTLCIFDINLRPPFIDPETIIQSLELANFLKLNDEELPLLARLCDLEGGDEKRMRQLTRKFNLRGVALTKGSEGSALLVEGHFHEQPAVPCELIDTVGAGDAFTAALALGLLSQQPIAVINENASKVAAYVCSQSGATPEIPASLLALD